MPVSEALRSFGPGWFGTVMGTGAVVLATHPFFPRLSAVLHPLNVLLMAVLVGVWLWRCLRLPSAVAEATAHPVQANFYPMLYIALMVVANQFAVVGGQRGLALVLWGVGTLLAFAFSYLLLGRLFRSEQVALEHVTPANYLPAVGLVLVPVVGARFIAGAGEFEQQALMVLNLMALGTGALMYVALLSLTVHKYLLHRRVTGPLAATVWIQLAPTGLVPLAAMRLVSAHPHWAGLAGAVELGSALVVGFGLWWLGMALSLTVAAMRQGELPFALSWWAFTFPLGALTLALQALAVSTGWALFSTIAFGGCCVLVCAWSLVALRTVHGVATGALLKA
jgi:C4-dicarboxylate transporter/malic acid transport protein